MSLPKRRIDIDPATPAREIFRLVREGDGDAELHLGEEVLEVHRRDTEPIMPDEVEQKAYDALRVMLDRDRPNVDPKPTREFTKEPRDMEAFFANVEALRELVDWDWVAAAVESDDSDAVGNLLRFAGTWADNSEIDAYLDYRENQRNGFTSEQTP